MNVVRTILQVITRVIIRHLGREVRTIRDLFITYLSIKDASEHALKPNENSHSTTRGK